MCFIHTSISTISGVSSLEVEGHVQTECNEDAVTPQESLDTYDQYVKESIHSVLM